MSKATRATATGAHALNDVSPEGVLWSRVNSGESLPGVLTPVTWSFYGKAIEVNLRRTFADLGMIPEAASAYPAEVADRFLGIFFGRIAVNVTVGRILFSGLPTVSGDDVERDMLGSVREGVVDDAYPRRLLPILIHAPQRILLSGKAAQNLYQEIEQWWRSRVGPDGPRDGVDPRVLLAEAQERFAATVRIQGQARMLLQAALSVLGALARRAGVPDAASSLMSGSAKTQEMAVADHLWELAHDRMTMPDFLARHGFYGPTSCELSTVVWREDAGAVERLLDAVRKSEPPAERRSRMARERDAVTERVLTALPLAYRTAARVALRLAPGTARALEQCKACMLMTTDGGRAAVRAIGEELVGDQVLSRPDDAFHLFSEELLGPMAFDISGTVAERVALREQCLAVEIAETWEGQPVPAARQVSDGSGPRITSVTGIGASPGTVEGTVRVVTDSDTDIDPGDILVCPTTDPSWLGLMTIAAGLVIDIGAIASHGAIVARELGVPCVIGTRTGTSVLRDGDRVRLDGGRGVVELIARDEE